MTGDMLRALPPGVYLVKTLGSDPALMMVTRHGRFQMLDQAVKPTTIRARLIDWVRPLEQQGGLSGALYWGEAIR